MEEQKKAELRAAGVDVEDVLGRFMNNETLMERFLKRFLQDENFERLKTEIKNEEKQGAYEASHTLKGVCGNLSMTELYRLFSKQVEALRGDRWEEAVSMMDEIETEYQKVTEAIRRI